MSGRSHREPAAALARRNARRAWRALRRLRESSPAGRRALAGLEAILRRRGSPERAGLLTGPGFRAWLCSAEEALELLRPSASDAALFARVARGRHMAHLVPRGHLDAGFRARVRALAARLRARLMAQLLPLLMFRLPAGVSVGPALPDLSPDGEEARAGGELFVEYPVPATARLRPRTRVVLRGATVRTDAGAPLAWRARPCLGDSGIVLARHVVSTRRGLRPGAGSAGAAARLEAALELLARAWPEARREVQGLTRIVVPVRERNTVSFSMPSRPAVSYINVEGKSLVDLADDLLHETAHHALHMMEESGPLVKDDGEPRYVSPWRRSLRPLRGILHATWTFSHRAELLARLLRLRGGPPLPAGWIRAELAFERDALAAGLRHVRDARARGLLTSRGEELLGIMRRLIRRIG